MTFFAKWRNPADIMVGSCSRETIPDQAQAGETLVVLDSFHRPADLYLDEADGKLKAAGRVVEVPYLDDQTLADLMVAVTERRDVDRGRARETIQRLKGAQTLTEADAVLVANGLTITPNDLAKARRNRELAQ